LKFIHALFPHPQVGVPWVYLPLYMYGLSEGKTFRLMQKMAKSV